MQKSLGEFIGELRKARGMTQQELANALGVHQTFVSALESGRKTGLSTKSLHRLCEICQVPLDTFAPYLAPGVTVPPPPSMTQQAHEYPLVGTVVASDVDTPDQYDTPYTMVSVAKKYPEDTIALRVRGKSCEPVIPDKSIVIVEPASEPVDGKFCVVANAAGCTLKLYTEGKLFRLGPTRKAIRLDASTRLVGIVRYVIQEDPDGK